MDFHNKLQPLYSQRSIPLILKTPENTNQNKFNHLTSQTARLAPLTQPKVYIKKKEKIRQPGFL